MTNERLAPILSWIETVVQGLGDLADSAVFVGGAVTSLLITDSNITRVRPTKDIDIIINTSRIGFYKLEDQLRARGFAQKMIGDDPICRWHYREVIVDIVPTDEKILSFSNRWYVEAFACANWLDLPSGSRIRLISAPLFIATKLVAFGDRGQGDFEESHDIEDIITVIDGRPELSQEAKRCSIEVQKFLSENFHALLNNDRFTSSIEWHLPYGSGGLDRVRVIEQRMRGCVN